MTAVLDRPAASPVTEAHLRQFEQKGFFVLERIIPDDLLALMRSACGSLIDQVDAKADAEGKPRTTKYFFSVWDEPAGANPVKDQAR